MFTEDMTIFEIPRSFRLRSGPIMKYKRDDPPTTSFIPVSDDSYFGMINGALTNRSTMEFHFISTSEFRKVYKTYDHVPLSTGTPSRNYKHVKYKHSVFGFYFAGRL